MVCPEPLVEAAALTLSCLQERRHCYVRLAIRSGQPKKLELQSQGVLYRPLRPHNHV